MQTFLPYRDYEKCAKVLDDKRLNKQVLEATQIFCILRDTGQSNCLGYSYYCPVCNGDKRIIRGLEATGVNNKLERSYAERKCTCKCKLKLVPWSHHPAVLMWTSYSAPLEDYIVAMNNEAISRFGMSPFRHTVSQRFNGPGLPSEKPATWHDRELVYLSYRLNLMRKDKAHYSKLFAEDLAKYPDYEKYDYVWPNRIGYPTPDYINLPLRNSKVQDRHVKLKPYDPFDL